MSSKVESPMPPSWKDQGYLPGRYLIAILLHLGFLFNYMLRVSINFSITAMVKEMNTTNETINDNDICNFEDLDDSDSQDYEGEFEWSVWTQSLITGSFYWGYMWTNIPGGRLAELYGGRLVFGLALASASVFSLLIPVAANIHYILLIVIRVTLGLCTGMTYPAAHAIIVNWAPPQDSSWITCLAHIGAEVGTIITFPLSAVLIESWGWQATFYVPAVLTLIWCCAWFMVVSDTPRNYRWMSQPELDYITKSIGDRKHQKSLPVPMRSIMTSLPFWTIVIAGWGDSWGFFTLLTDLPLYMKTILKQDINSNALYSGLPYVGFVMFELLVSFTGDALRSRGIISTITLRKFANSIAHIGPGIILLCMSFVECNREVTIAFFFIAVMLQGGATTGFPVNILDIGPNYAGTLLGLQNAVAAIPGFLAPMTAGALTDQNQTIGAWRKVFYIAAAMYILDGTFYLLFASGEEQPWNKKNIHKFSDKSANNKDIASISSICTNSNSAKTKNSSSSTTNSSHSIRGSRRTSSHSSKSSNSNNNLPQEIPRKIELGSPYSNGGFVNS